MIRTRTVRRIRESGLLELVGKDETLEYGKYSKSVGFDLTPGSSSGELLKVVLYAFTEGSGAVQTSAGRLLVFSADPEVSANAAALTVAARKMILADVGVIVESVEWSTDANGGSVAISFEPPAVFHSVSALYVVWEHWSTTALNDAEADDETLHVNIWYEDAGAHK